MHETATMEFHWEKVANSVILIVYYQCFVSSGDCYNRRFADTLFDFSDFERKERFVDDTILFTQN